MPLPNCFAILNPAYFENLLLSVNAAATETELQALINQVYADISLLESTITSQLAFLGPISALLSAPSASPGAIVTWITGLIDNVLTPLVKPLATYAAQLTALAAAVASLTTAIEDAASLKGFTVTIPPIAIVCTL